MQSCSLSGRCWRVLPCVRVRAGGGLSGVKEQTGHEPRLLPRMGPTSGTRQAGPRLITRLDLKHGDHQTPLHPRSRPPQGRASTAGCDHNVGGGVGVVGQRLPLGLPRP